MIGGSHVHHAQRLHLVPGRVVEVDHVHRERLSEIHQRSWSSWPSGSGLRTSAARLTLQALRSSDEMFIRVRVLQLAGQLVVGWVPEILVQLLADGRPLGRDLLTEGDATRALPFLIWNQLGLIEVRSVLRDPAPGLVYRKGRVLPEVRHGLQVGLQDTAGEPPWVMGCRPSLCTLNPSMPTVTLFPQDLLEGARGGRQSNGFPQPLLPIQAHHAEATKVQVERVAARVLHPFPHQRFLPPGWYDHHSSSVTA